MGEAILIPALVVLVIGGIGSVRGAFVAALLVGVVDTVGRAFVPMLLRATLPPATAADLGPLFAEARDVRADGGGPHLPALGPFLGARMKLSHATSASGCSSCCSRRFRWSRRSSGSTSTSASCGACSSWRWLRTSLNFILGFGGMVALGHAGFIGVGAYTVVALSDAGVMSAWVLWPLAALRGRPRRGADRHGGAAHARRVLHHDHAGLRADAVLRGGVAAPLWRRRRLHADVATHAAAGAGPGQ